MYEDDESFLGGMVAVVSGQVVNCVVGLVVVIVVVLFRDLGFGYDYYVKFLLGKMCDNCLGLYQGLSRGPDVEMSNF